MLCGAVCGSPVMNGEVHVITGVVRIAPSTFQNLNERNTNEKSNKNHVSLAATFFNLNWKIDFHFSPHKSATNLKLTN